MQKPVELQNRDHEDVRIKQGMPPSMDLRKNASLYGHHPLLSVFNGINALISAASWCIPDAVQPSLPSYKLASVSHSASGLGELNLLLQCRSFNLQFEIC